LFVGRQARGLDKSSFLRHLRHSHFLSAEVSFDSASKVNIPSGQVVPDDYFFDFPAIDEEAWCNILVFRNPLEGNWFARSNFGEFCHDSRESIIVAVTSYELEDFSEDAEISLEKALAANVLRSIVSAEYVKSGGKFWNLYTKYSEEDAFAFCKDKTEIVDKLVNGSLGARPKKILGSSGYTDERLARLERDLVVLSQSAMDRFLLAARKNRDIIISTVFFVLGVLATLMFEMLLA
tara:strand:+ start:237 stop:944 length:708 start_codon:yes stop_codon:yes gene_type:complete